MANDSSKPGDHSSEAPKQRSEKASENLAKASPELNASNLRSAQKANPNRTDTVSPDGKSRFSLTDDSKTNDKQAKAVQEKAYRDAGLGDPHKPIGKPSESGIDHQKITEQAAKALSKIMDSGKSALNEGAKLWQGAHNGMHELVDESVKSVGVAKDYYGSALSGKVNFTGDVKEFASAVSKGVSQSLGTAGDYYFRQVPKGETNLGKDIATASKAAADHWNTMDSEQKGHFIGKEVVPLLVPGAVGVVAKEVQGANLVAKTGEAITAFSSSEKFAEFDQKLAQLQGHIQKMQELAKPMQPAFATASDGPSRQLHVPEIPSKGDSLFAMSAESDGSAGKLGGFKGGGMDSTGKPLSFSKESGIEIGSARQGQDKVWEQGPFPRGDDVHVVLGENLPSGTKTIDRVVFRDGIAEGQKSIDLTAETYSSPNKLESKLRGYMHDMQIYDGQKNTRMSFRMKEQEIEQKVLHIGIKDESMTPQQKKVFEKVGEEIQAYSDNLPIGKAPLKMKVTVVK